MDVEAHADVATITETRPDPSVGDLVRLHLEPSRLGGAYGFAGLDPLYFETSVVPHFSILPRKFRAALFLTPKIVLRMFRQASEPVKTPSYMPRLTAVLWFEDMPDPFAPYFFLTLEHHSNGQSGPFRENGRNNHESGSFETNEAELGACLVEPERRAFGWNCLSIEYHPPFSEDQELRGSYGDTRVHWATTAFSTRPPTVWSLSARVTAIAGAMTKPTNASTLWSRVPIYLQGSVHTPEVGLGFYAAYYQGQDYYNIWYDRFVSLVELGVVGNLTTGLE